MQKAAVIIFSFLLLMMVAVMETPAFAAALPSSGQNSVIGINHGVSKLSQYGIFWTRNGSESFDPLPFELTVIGKEDFPKGIPSPKQLKTFLLQYLKKHPEKTHFEFWNEVNTPWSFSKTCEGDPNRSGFVCFKASAEAYTRLLKVFSTTIRKARPDAVIALGALADSWPEKYLEFIYQAGGKDFFDLVQFNPEYVKLPDVSRTNKQPYPELAAAPELKGDIYRRGTRKKIQAVANMMDKYQDHDKKIWIAETGYSLSGDRAFVESREQQLDYLIRAMILSFAEPKVERFFLYRWGKGGIEGDFEISENSLNAMATLADIFAKFEFEKAIEKGDTFEYVFREKKGKGKVSFFWSLKNATPYERSFSSAVKFYSIFGEELKAPKTLSPRPILKTKGYRPKQFSIDLSDKN